MPRRLAGFDGPRRGPLLIGLIVALPIIAAQIKLFGDHWYPGGDMAQAELHVRGLWSHPPLVGAAGRIASEAGLQGSHPGPSLWVALWPIYALFGRTSRGLIVSVGAVHLVAIFATCWLARRRGGTLLMVSVAAALGLLIRASGTDFATEPWNPWLAVIPFAAFILLCWSLLDGERWAWPAAVLAGSHCIHCHAGYGVVVIAVLGTTTLTVCVAEWTGRRRGAQASGPSGRQPARALGFWGALIAAIGAGLIIWLPPLIDQFRRSPGNLTILRHQFGSPSEPYIASGDAARIIGNQLNLFGPWIRGREHLGVAGLGLFLFLAVWGTAAVVAVRRRDASQLRIHALLAVGSVAGCLSVTRLFGGYFEYTVRWWWVLSALITAASVWTILDGGSIPDAVDGVVPDDATIGSSDQAAARAGGRHGLTASAGGNTSIARRLRSATAWTSGLALLLVVVAVIGAVQATDRAHLPGPADSTIIGGLSPALVDELDAIAAAGPDGADQRYLMRWWDPQYLGASAFGLVLELERQGIDVGVDPPFSAAALPHRVVSETEANGGVLYLVIGARIDEVRAQPGVSELASFDIRTPDQAARSAVVHDDLIRRLDEIGLPELADRLDQQYGLTSLLFSSVPLPGDISALVVEYLQLGQPAAVFLVAPGMQLQAIPELAGAAG